MIGFSFFKWLKLLYFNGFVIRMKHVPKVMGITIVSFILYPFVLFERFKDRKRIKETKIVHDPIFILGHWRTGTTHLHKMMVLDEQFDFLSLTETAFPHLILGRSRMLHNVMRPFTPKRRPTDNVEMFPEMPHEHEFAHMALCSHSPILGITFPNKFDHYMRFTTFKDASDKEIKEFKEQFVFLIKTLTIKSKGKQLVLKNPLDTCRIDILLELFPNSKFVHIFRNPYDLFYSTLKLHKHNAEIYALQKPTYDLHKLVLDNFVEMYDTFYKEIDLIPKENYVEVKFEDLAQDPIRELKTIYKELSLENFERAQPRIQEYLDSVAGYQPAQYDMDPEVKEKINTKWSHITKKWGYEEN